MDRLLTPEQINENTERVAAGAAWLDKVNPDWFRILDLERLDLISPCGCVIGQLVADATYADFYTVVGGADSPDDWCERKLESVHQDAQPYVMSHWEAIDRGFQVDFRRWNYLDPNPTHVPGTLGDNDYSNLTELWKRQALDRLNDA